MLENNKRIAKNTVLLYIRMGMSLLVSLYTSRVILNALGINDFGIYNVVGGVVAMVGFLNASMSGSTSRFLTFELGKGNLKRLNETFCSSLIIHIGISLVVVVLAETIGLWFLYNKLVIPADRMAAAVFVYHISVLTTALEITQVPYSASIVSHEKFGIYAYIEMLNVCIRLSSVYILLIGEGDKLKLFSILVFAGAFIIMMIYRIYCVRKFDECRFRWVYDKSILLPMLSFSGWDLYGNVCVTARHQGMTMLINLFFGTVVNAAASIALTVQTTVSNLVVNILSAFRPQIIKQYAIGDYEYMKRLMLHCCKFLSILFMLLSIPLFFEMHFVMHLWLGIIPEGAVNFAQIALLTNWIGLINSIFIIPIYATGKIKHYSFFTGTLFLLALVAMYITLKSGGTSTSVFICMLFSNLSALITNIIILKLLIKDFPLILFIRQAFVPVACVLLLSIPLFILLNSIEEEGWRRLLISISLSLTIISSLSYFIILDSQQRSIFYQFIKNKNPWRKSV